MPAPCEGRTIGLFGGTFDPVHSGHLHLARHVLDRCRLDSLLFIPAPRPPHKRQTAVSFAHRAAMLEAALLAADNHGRMQCSYIEEHLPTPSYTINTVEALTRQAPGQRFSLIIGADSLFDLPHWRRSDELLALVDLIVVRRDTVDAVMINQALVSLDPAFRFDEPQGRWNGPGGRTVTYLSDIELPVSSSSIREELAQGRIPVMLPPAVFAYIKTHHLYGWQDSA